MHKIEIAFQKRERNGKVTSPILSHSDLSFRAGQINQLILLVDTPFLGMIYARKMNFGLLFALLTQNLPIVGDLNYYALSHHGKELEPISRSVSRSPKLLKAIIGNSKIYSSTSERFRFGSIGIRTIKYVIGMFCKLHVPIPVYTNNIFIDILGNVYLL